MGIFKPGFARQSPLASKFRFSVVNGGAIEEVVSGVGRARFLAEVVCIAPGSGGNATRCIHALDVAGARKNARPFGGPALKQQPGDRIRRRDTVDHRANDCAPAFALPGWSGIVNADHISVCVE